MGMSGVGPLALRRNILTRRMVSPEALSLCYRNFMELYAAAYGASTMLPKFHFLVHCSGSLRRFGFLPNTMALERKHKEIKRYGSAISNHLSTTPSTLREVTTHHLYVMDEGDHLNLTPRWIDAHEAPSCVYAELSMGKKAELKLSSVARISAWEVAHKGDILAVAAEPSTGNWVAGPVRYFMARDDENWCCLCMLMCEQRERTHSRWSECDRLCLVPFSNLRHVFVYSNTVDGIVLLHPYGL